jgi:hypothetical protein
LFTGFRPAFTRLLLRLHGPVILTSAFGKITGAFEFPFYFLGVVNGFAVFAAARQHFIEGHT